MAVGNEALVLGCELPGNADGTTLRRPVAPDSIDSDPQSLPRAFRGYNRGATEELFRRVAWDYAVLAGEHRKLKQNGDEPKPLARTHRADLDEEAHSLLAAAVKAARELRESTRAECEQALRKAKGRAAEIEQEAVRAATDARAVLDGAAKLRANLQETLRSVEDEDLVAPDPVAPDHLARASALRD
jgi:cell division septum initiation protein DivIVA